MTLKIKAEFQPCFRLVTDAVNIDQFDQELQNHLEKAPNLLKHAKIIIDLQNYLSLEELIALANRRNLVLWGVASGNEDVLAQASNLSIPIVAASVMKRSVQETESSARQTQVITRPVRSGQQIYARDKNLIITAHVGNGAEVIADGDIQIWGTMRGRAIAGASGDQSSTILVKEMRAELVSVAGIYQVQEDMPELQGTVKVSLNGGKLNTEEIY